SDLAGCVPGDGQRQVGGGDAAAIVADPDQADTAFLQVDVDAARACIERVFHQFLDHGRRTLDDLTGCDLVDEDVGKLLDGHAPMIRDRPRPAPRVPGRVRLGTAAL